MKRPYSLDYSIERDTDRVEAVRDILDKLPNDPPPSELEQMASYILYGKDQNGQNAVQRGETINTNVRYNTFKNKDDKNASLDVLLDNPMVNQQELKNPHERNIYTNKKPIIQRPKYNKKTGELIDKGDSDIPGMQQIWDSIDRMEHWIAVIEGKVPPHEDDLLFNNSYRLYQLKHTLIDLRRHQYYLKDAYKPTLHLLNLDHPKPQFYDWTQDSFYWVTFEEWQKKTQHSFNPLISKRIEDYEVREIAGEKQVKWVVRHHTFNWEDPCHVRALIAHYDSLEQQVGEKFDTYGWTLLWDFKRYRAMANLSPIREFLLDRRLQHIPYTTILEDLRANFDVQYNENHLSTIFSKEIPEKIALAAAKHHLMADSKFHDCKICFTCKMALPRHPLFFSRNRSRRDGYASNCKECEKKKRQAKLQQIKELTPNDKK